MPSIFSKIVSGEINCHKIHENDEFLAFLDVNPLAIGHTLVIPKIEVDYIFDIEDDILSRMIVFSKIVAKQLHSKIDCKRIRLSIVVSSLIEVYKWTKMIEIRIKKIFLVLRVIKKCYKQVMVRCKIHSSQIVSLFD